MVSDTDYAAERRGARRGRHDHPTEGIEPAAAGMDAFRRLARSHQGETGTSRIPLYARRTERGRLSRGPRAQHALPRYGRSRALANRGAEDVRLSTAGKL